ncbi:MAG: hypothetical protein WD023_08960 [Ilumatobacteraceae bacterium]
MSRVEEIGDRDQWRCWLCDEVVDPDMSVNDPRGPSVDSVTTKQRTKATGVVHERLAHRGCNTNKGAVAPVVPWPAQLFVIDPAPLFATVETLERKRGRAIVCRCLTRADADDVVAWLADRVERLSPRTRLGVTVESGGGQFLIVLSTS